MSWFSSAVHWMVALDPAKVGAWATASSALISVAVVGATVWVGFLTRILARETRHTREVSERADVQCSVESSERSIQLMELVVVNVGKSSAKEVNIKIERGGKFHNVSKPVFPFSVFLPGRSIRIFIGSYIDMADKVFAANITYKDKFGEHSFAYREDLSQWLSMSQLGSLPMTVMADNLKKIAETVEGWQRSSRVKVDMFDRQDRKTEYEELEKNMAECSKEDGSTPQS